MGNIPGISEQSPDTTPNPASIQPGTCEFTLQPWLLRIPTIFAIPDLSWQSCVVITCLPPQPQPKLPHLSRPVTLQPTQGEDLSRLKQSQKGKKRWLMHQMWRRQQKSLRNIENKKNMTTPKEQNKFQQVKPTNYWSKNWKELFTKAPKEYKETTQGNQENNVRWDN